MVDVRHLRYFVAVVRRMHFNRAAMDLHISQPSLTLAIKQLEEQLGVKLLRRTTRAIQLTPAGRTFYEDAIHTLKCLDQACRKAKSAAQGEAGRLTIGFVTTAMMGSLRGMIQSFHKLFPQVELVLHEMSIDALLEKLYEGELDLVCSDGGVTDQAFTSKPIISPRWVLAVHKSNKLAHSSAISISQAMKQPFIVATDHPYHNLQRKMIQVCNQAEFSPDIRVCVDSVPSAVSLVEANLGVAMVYDIPTCRPPEVLYKDVEGANMDVTMHLCWGKDNLSPTASNFVQLGGLSEG